MLGVIGFLFLCSLGGMKELEENKNGCRALDFDRFHQNCVEKG